VTTSSSARSPRSTERGHRTALGFRPDIQGIRALAVGLVVVHHLVPTRLTGGYVGVDVFFVVSGYLITALLLREVERDGTVSLAGFYARRARRILPAATVVTVATVLGSLLTLSLLRTQSVVVDAVWSAFFAANVRFALTGTDYFAQGQPPSPFRHYWSLAVEEQFYLVWPLLLLGCVVWWHRSGRRGSVRRTAAPLLALLVTASVAWSAWATYDSPTTAYFSTFTRGYELGIGALCAALPRTVRLAGPVRTGLTGAGLLGIAVAALGYTPTTPFPGTAALLPVLATAALVVAGDGPAGHAPGVTRALGAPLLRRVGDWSYSLYLWHWPVIVLVRSNLGPERFSTLPVLGGVLAAIVLLSWATYRWVETPFRTGRAWRRVPRALLIYPVSVAMVLAAAVVSTRLIAHQLGGDSDEPAITTGDYEGRRLGRDPSTALVRASVLAAREGRAVPGDLTPGLIDLRSQTAPLGDCDYRAGTTGLCPIGDEDAERDIVVLGDSHARALSPAIEEIGETHGYRVHVLVFSGCAATDLVQVRQETGRAWEECERFKDWALQTVEDLAPELVVVSTSTGRMLDPATGESLAGRTRTARYLDLLRTGWEALFADLDARAGDVAVVGDTPKLPRESGVCLARGEPDLGDCAFRPERRPHREAEASFAAARATGTRVVDASPWFCADGLCPPVVGRFITLRDSEHMTPDYSRWLADPLARSLGLGPAEASG